MSANIKHVDFPNKLQADIHVCLEAEPITKEHAHDFVELGYVLGGTAIHHLPGDVDYPVLPGDVYLIEPGVLHYYSEVKHLKVCYLLLGLAGLREILEHTEGFKELDVLMGRDPTTSEQARSCWYAHLPSEVAEEVETLLDRIGLELETRQPGYRPLFHALLVELFVLLSRMDREEPPGTKDQDQADINQTRINTVKTFIEEHYASDLKIADIARCASLAPQYLCRVFKKITGISMIEYLTNIRIHQACLLLRETTLPITEVCFRAGFNDLSHFIRTFRKTIGSAPSKYRKKS